MLNSAIAPKENAPSGAAPFLTKTELVNLLFRAYPQPLSESSLSIADRTTVLAGIASVLSELGYHRKKALILKELTSGLLPALVQARKAGAAEMGVHPAASLTTLNATTRAIPLESAGSPHDDSEEGVRHLLSLVCQAYGITSQKPMASPSLNAASTSRMEAEGLSSLPPANAAEVTVTRALKQASSKACGSQNLKTDILRSCINLCEALPDLGGALRYSAELLRIGGSGIAPGPDSSDGSPDIPMEEQVRLANNIARTLSAARHLGLEHPEADYWDDFLVRGIEIVKTNPSRGLLPHAKSELEIVETIDAKKENDPFIYNPFLKAKAMGVAEPVLVADEEAFFRITLQNLYDFDIVIEWIKLVSHGVSFECSPQPTSIGPYRTQTILLSGTPQSAGSLDILGCAAKVRGCRERSFPMFKEPWSLKADAKGRHVQLKDEGRPPSTVPDAGKGKENLSPKGPTAVTLALNVIGAQPDLVMKSISTPQSAVMLLEGETKRFTVTLQNRSRKTTVDLLLVSFDDSTASRGQSALSSKEFSPVELYELEIESAQKQSFQWLRKKDQVLQMMPGEEVCLEVEILGKPGLSYGTIQVDYGHLGMFKADIKDRFYTRQLIIPLTVTVNASIDLIRNDFVTLPRDLQPSQAQKFQESNGSIQDPSTKAISHTPSLSVERLQPLLERINYSSSLTPHCLLLLNFHNLSRNTLTITLDLSDPDSSQQPFKHTQTITPGTTQRIPFPIPRIYLPDADAPIPSLNPANKRQFVVSATKSSPEVERAMREAFWYREALLKRLNATWREECTGRTGNVSLRSLQLTTSMISTFKLSDLSIHLSITAAEPNATVTQTSPSTFHAPTDTFLTLLATLHNRSSAPIRPLLRLQPTLANQPPGIALDLSKKLLVNGVLQRPLPTLEPGATAEIKTGFCVLARGIYEWGAIAEEVSTTEEVDESGRTRARTRADTGDLDLELLGGMGRRVWGAEESFTVIAS